MKSPGLALTATLAVVALLGCADIDFNIEGPALPIGTEDRAVFDAGLVGVWRSDATDDDSPAELVIRSRNGRTYQISMREAGDDSVLELTGYVVDLGGVRVLNAAGAGEHAAWVKGYFLFQYQVEAPDVLTVTPLRSEGWGDRGVNSAEELFQYLRDHLHEGMLNAEPTHYRRVSLWGARSDHPTQATTGESGG